MEVIYTCEILLIIFYTGSIPVSISKCVQNKEVTKLFSVHVYSSSYGNHVVLSHQRSKVTSCCNNVRMNYDHTMTVYRGHGGKNPPHIQISALDEGK
jgi:hypothetical protein